jgi:hypothetical protein
VKVLCRLAIGGDDQNGVISCNRSDDLFEFLPIDANS